jgi:hypothetical protein
MNRFKYLVAATALASLSAPILAQDEPEEVRTSYQVSFVRFADDAGARWLELMNDHFIPARQAASLPVPTVHWMMDGAWDLMLVTEMPNGLGALDSHNPPAVVAYREALLAQEGSEEAVTALNTEMDGLVEAGQRFYSHTHP